VCLTYTPYVAVRLLICVGHASSPYITTFVARLWATVGKFFAPTKRETFLIFLALANHRFFIHFGEDHCRLSSDQAILEAPDSKESLVLAVLSKTLLFGLPNRHKARFERLWVDQLAYTSPWRKHVSETAEDLKQMMSRVSSIATSVGSLLTVSLRPSHFFCESLFLRRRPR
jgi:hypothetical protein